MWQRLEPWERVCIHLNETASWMFSGTAQKEIGVHLWSQDEGPEVGKRLDWSRDSQHMEKGCGGWQEYLARGHSTLVLDQWARANCSQGVWIPVERQKRNKMTSDRTSAEDTKLSETRGRDWGTNVDLEKGFSTGFLKRHSRLEI